MMIIKKIFFFYNFKINKVAKPIGFCYNKKKTLLGGFKKPVE